MKTINESTLLQILKRSSTPIEIFELSFPENTYRLVNFNIDVVYDGDTYVAHGINRGRIERNLGGQVDTVTLEMNALENTNLSRSFMYREITGSYLKITKLFYDIITDSTHGVVVFYGRVATPSINSGWMMSLEAEADMLDQVITLK